jgi:hypothetical protein
MNQYQENRLSMFFSTQQVLADNNALWAGIPAMVNLTAEFDGNISTIRGLVERQVIDITGHTKDKAAAEDAMITSTLRIAGAAMAYAEDQDDQGLAEAMNIVPSELKRYRDSVVAERCQSVVTTVTPIIASLAPYGVMPADVTALQTAIDKYLDLVQKPRTMISNRKGATSELGMMIRDTMRLLDRRMDMLMRGFMTTQPGFHNAYTNARIIVDLGGQKEEQVPDVA